MVTYVRQRGQLDGMLDCLLSIPASNLLACWMIPTFALCLGFLICGDIAHWDADVTISYCARMGEKEHVEGSGVD